MSQQFTVFIAFTRDRVIFSTPISGTRLNCNSVLEKSELSYGLCGYINVHDTHILTDIKIVKGKY